MLWSTLRAGMRCFNRLYARKVSARSKLTCVETVSRTKRARVGPSVLLTTRATTLPLRLTAPTTGVFPRIAASVGAAFLVPMSVIVEIVSPGPAAGTADRAEERGEAACDGVWQIGPRSSRGDRKRASFAVWMSALRRARRPAVGRLDERAIGRPLIANAISADGALSDGDYPSLQVRDNHLSD